MASDLGRVWVQAGADLGFRVSAPFALTTDAGRVLHYDAAVHDFGSKNGMLLMESWSKEKGDAAAHSGFGYSCMGAGAYDRQSTIEVLQDWGWSGSGPPPEWL